MKTLVKPFVFICTSFFVGNKFATFSIIVRSEKMDEFIYSFNSFYERCGWYSFNEDLQLSYYFRFLNLPDFTPNILRSNGFKPDFRFITFSKYITSILSK